MLVKQVQNWLDSLYNSRLAVPIFLNIKLDSFPFITHLIYLRFKLPLFRRYFRDLKDLVNYVHHSHFYEIKQTLGEVMFNFKDWVSDLLDDFEVTDLEIGVLEGCDDW